MPKINSSVKFIFMILWVISSLGCNEKKTPQEKIIPSVKVQVIGSDLDQRNIQVFNGIASGINSVILSFRVSGVLEKIAGKVGDIRKTGEVLAKLDQRDFKFKVDNLRGQLQGAQADLDILQRGERKENVQKLEAQILSLKSKLRTAEFEFDRVQQLFANDAASKSRLDQAKSDRDLAVSNLETSEQEHAIALKGGREEEVLGQEAKVRSINADLNQAQADLNDTVLKMPFDGLIAVKHINNFEQIQKGQKIYDVEAIDRIEIEVSIPDKFIPYVKKSQSVKTEFLNLPGKVFDGIITKVGLSADKITLTYPVWIEIPNPVREILPGMSAEVSINFQGLDSSQPLLPIHSVLEDFSAKQFYVWVFDEKARVARRKNVSIGNIVKNQIEVTEGIAGGETIIVAGLDQLSDGMAVRLPKK